MPRVRKGAARRQAKKRVLKAVKGHRGSAGDYPIERSMSPAGHKVQRIHQWL